MKTKRQIQEEFKISIDQLRRAIEAVGLPTGSTSYTDEEVEIFIGPAVTALYKSDPKSTVEEVREWADEVRRSRSKVDGRGYAALREEVLDVIDDTMGEIIERDADVIVERLYGQFAKNVGRLRGAAQVLRMKVASRMMDDYARREPRRGLGAAPHNEYDDIIDADSEEVPES